MVQRDPSSYNGQSVDVLRFTPDEQALAHLSPEPIPDELSSGVIGYILDLMNSEYDVIGPGTPGVGRSITLAELAAIDRAERLEDLAIAVAEETATPLRVRAGVFIAEIRKAKARRLEATSQQDSRIA